MTKRGNRLILGTVQLGMPYGINNHSGQPSTQLGVEILKIAYESGIRFLDTAEGYGGAQEVIGAFHRQYNDSFSVITKLSAGNLDQHELLSDIVRHDLETLKVDRLDGYMFHNYKDFFTYGARIEELQLLKDKNIIGHIGVSVYSNQEADAVLDNPAIDFIQLPFNLLDNTTKRAGILKKAREKRISVHVRSVYLQGLFHMTRQQMPVKLRPLTPYLELLQELALSNGMSLPEMAIRYAFSNEFIDRILIGVETKEQLLWNIELADKQLPEEMVHQIDAINVMEQDLLSPVNWS